MISRIKGKAWVFGDDISADEILPTQYQHLSDPEDLAKHAMEVISPSFSSQVEPGDIIVAGENFCSGSSREHAPLSLIGTGVGAIVAKSFSRLFFRNSFNLGLAAITCPEAVDEVDEGDILELKIDQGIIKNCTKNREYGFQEVPDFLLDYLERGGLINYLLEQ